MINRTILLPAVGCVFFGALILFELSAPMTHPIPPATVPPKLDNKPAVLSNVRADPTELVSTILARPLFSPTRHPPPRTGTETSSTLDLGGARLTGIVIAPGVRLAIFDLKGSKPVLLNEGETISGWRVDSIAPSEVSLVGPGGLKTLQPKLDPAHTASGPPPASAARLQPAPPPPSATQVQPAPPPPSAARVQPAPPPPSGPPIRPRGLGRQPHD
jgi:hypothetical protein